MASFYSSLKAEGKEIQIRSNSLTEEVKADPVDEYEALVATPYSYEMRPQDEKAVLDQHNYYRSKAKPSASNMENMVGMKTWK